MLEGVGAPNETVAAGAEGFSTGVVFVSKLKDCFSSVFGAKDGALNRAGQKLRKVYFSRILKIFLNFTEHF